MPSESRFEEVLSDTDSITCHLQKGHRTSRQFTRSRPGSLSFQVTTVDAIPGNPLDLHKEKAMIAELQLLEEWIPEQMEPGTLFVLENAGTMGEATNPYWAVLSCPVCGALGLITRRQYRGTETMICGAYDCSAEYYLREGGIEYRHTQ